MDKLSHYIPMKTYALFYFHFEQSEVLERQIAGIFHSFEKFRNNLFIIYGGEDTELTLKLSLQFLQTFSNSIAKESLKIFIYSNNEFPDASILDSLFLLMTEYDSKISLNHVSFAQLLNPNSYNFRFLGLFPSGKNNQSISVFDFIENCENSPTNDKIESKAVFEDSVFNFYTNRIAQSIAEFQNVLLLFPEDRASMKYIERGNYLLSN